MSLRGLNRYEQHFFLSNRIVRFLLGLNRNENLNGVIIRNYLIMIYVFLTIFYQLYQFTQITMNSQTAYSLLQKFLTALGISCSYCVFNFQLSTVRDLVSYMKDDYEQTLDENELKISEKYIKNSRLYIIIIVGFLILYGILIIIPTVSSIVLYMCRSLDNANIPLVFPMNYTNSGLIRYVLILLQMITLFIILTITSVIYSVYLVFVLHPCTQFNILIYNIRQQFAKEKCIEKNWNNQTNQKESEWIFNIIKKYTRVTKFVHLVNTFYKIIYLIGIIFSTIIIFFNILYILELPVILQNNTSKILECFVSVFGFIFIIYIIIHFGQILINHSSETFEELCQIPYYKLSKKNQKLLLLIIMRSMKPCELSIGGLFSASHDIFAGLMQKAFSFAMAYYNLVQSN